MKILWVKSGGLAPLDSGGKIRSYQILRELCRRHEVTLALSYAAKEDGAHGELESQFARLIRWPVAAPEWGTLAGRTAYVRNFLSTRPRSVVRFCRPEMARELRSLARAERIDLIVCDFVFAAPMVPWNVDVPKVLFTHNVEATICRRHFEVERNPIWKAVWWREYMSAARMERKYILAADHVLTVSEEDRRHFCKFSDAAKSTAIPTGVDIRYFQPQPAMEEANNLVFTGSMDWRPNEDGITFFAQTIFPKIRRSIPGAVLWVVGRNPSTALQRVAEKESGIRVTGRVEDVRPYMGRGSVYVVPLRVGSGTRLKIFEAMAMGKAVVSTTIGAEGLPVTHGKNVLLADEPDDFANQVTGLLQNEPRRHELGSAARDLVEQHYSWERVAGDCEAIFNRVVEQYAQKKAMNMGLSKPIEGFPQVDQ
ncbi:MAG: glycosyltransferase [Candidatus Acidiferrales bacterium]